MAAVTLVALGSACPEIMLNSIGVLRHNSDLSLPAILGSAFLAFGIIPPLSILCNTATEQRLKVWPILRMVLNLLIKTRVYFIRTKDSILHHWIGSFFTRHSRRRNRHLGRATNNFRYLIQSLESIYKIIILVYQ